MTVIATINRSTLSQKQKRQVRKGLRDQTQIKVLPSTYTHAQSNDTLASISGFRLPVTKGTTYMYTIGLTCTGNASGGAKFGVSAPTASFCVGQVQVDGASTSTTALASLVGGATAAAVEILAVGTYKPSADGYFQIQAAQNASHASDTAVLAGSFVKLEEVLT